MRESLKVLDLFSGIGSFAYAAEEIHQISGERVFETVAFCESNDYCQQVLRKHWPTVPIFDDVRAVTADVVYDRGIGRIDVIVAGPPCQPTSFAGKRKGVLDERWLWPEYARLVREIRPQYVIVENPLGLLTCGMGQILGDLSTIGYDAEWSVLSACAVGAPHTRERVFLLAYPEGFGVEGGRTAGKPITGALVEAVLPDRGVAGTRAAQWASEPAVDRMVTRPSRRILRPPLEALGNTIVPQCAEIVLRRVAEMTLRCST